MLEQDGVVHRGFSGYLAGQQTALWRSAITKMMGQIGETEAASWTCRLGGVGRWHILMFLHQQASDQVSWQDSWHEKSPDTFLQGQRFPKHRNELTTKLNIP